MGEPIRTARGAIDAVNTRPFFVFGLQLRVIVSMDLISAGQFASVGEGGRKRFMDAAQALTENSGDDESTVLSIVFRTNCRFFEFSETNMVHF